jgi:NADPH:quinone reductase-like Zn-dependent oxidoreductase/acyl carrier protein
VTGFVVGDRVAAMGPNSFDEFMVTDARLAAKLPEGMSFASGATIPVVFLTAEYALRRLAKLAAGETLLVHSAAGGVGHAAIQIARRIGARVIATAGNPEKREYVKRQGIEHVFDSRTLDFADDVLRVTGGRGVDVVLNFLPGEAIEANLRALARGGRFVEIGKIDIWDEKRMSEARPDVQYDILALDELAMNQPALIEEVAGPLMAEFEAGAYQGLPTTEFELSAVRDAFRYMAQGLHIGKVVIKHAERDRESLVALQDVYAGRTWLVTGGLGGLGLHCVRHLAASGARDIVILSRSAPSEGVQATLEEIAVGGARLTIRAVDVTDYSALEGLMREIDAEHLPLGGVLHLAGVVDDGMIANLDWPRFEKVLRPKVLGAWNLHRLTRDRDLAAFVLFSSAASLIGSLGQANYAAANGFLDALAFERRAAGLPGLSINWGPWSEGGMASRAAETARSQWKLMGLGTLGPDDGLQILQLLLDEEAIEAAVLPMDWKKVLGRYPQGAEPPLLAALAGEQRAAAEPSKEWLELVARLKEAPPAERVDVLMAHIQKEAQAVLGMDVSRTLDPHTPLNELGFDSLTAVELSNRFTNASGISLSLTLLFDYPTLEAMSTHIVRDVLKLDIGEAPASRPRGAEREAPQGDVEELTSMLLESIGQMSDEDVERRVKELRERS